MNFTSGEENEKIKVEANKYPKPNECLDKCPAGTYINEESK